MKSLLQEEVLTHGFKTHPGNKVPTTLKRAAVGRDPFTSVAPWLYRLESRLINPGPIVRIHADVIADFHTLKING